MEAKVKSGAMPMMAYNEEIEDLRSQVATFTNEVQVLDHQLRLEHLERDVRNLKHDYTEDLAITLNIDSDFSLRSIERCFQGWWGDLLHQFFQWEPTTVFWSLLPKFNKFPDEEPKENSKHTLLEGVKVELDPPRIIQLKTM